MELKQKHIDQLKVIIQKNTGQLPTDSEAWEMGQRLINLYCLVLDIEPIKKVRTSSNLPKTPDDQYN